MIWNLLSSRTLCSECKLREGVIWEGVTAVNCREIHRKSLTASGGWAGKQPAGGE